MFQRRDPRIVALDGLSLAYLNTLALRSKLGAEISAVVVAVVGSTVALAKALDQRPAAASTAARSPADGGADDPEAFKQLVDGGMDKAEAMAKAGLE